MERENSNAKAPKENIKKAGPEGPACLFQLASFLCR
jgi:hypothetical protein